MEEGKSSPGMPMWERDRGLPGGEGHGDQRGFSRITADPREPTFEEMAHF